MSYLVLARKSRPQTFDQVVGQKPVVKTLQNSLKRDRVAHAILFSGVRGVGKTTLARIMAKALNCEGDTAARPCNTCGPCREIMNGTALDLIEIDGASNRGIQEIRELKEKIKFVPTSCRLKIIIIDEVHMLTTEAFNALLKTLEEPPPHVHFMFATTEIHKIPITILSRCQRYELQRISAAELSTHFSTLAEKEGIAIEPSALSTIVREAGGSVRDGLSLLDQVFSFGEQHITSQDVSEVLGLVDRELLYSLTESLLAGDRASALNALEDVFSYGMDIRRFCSDLLECFRTLLLTRIEGCGELIDLPSEDVQRITATGTRFTPQTIHQKLTLLMKLVEDVRYSSQPRLALETGFLSIIEASQVIPVTDLVGKVEQLLQTGPAASPDKALPAAPTLQRDETSPDKKKTSLQAEQNGSGSTASPSGPTVNVSSHHDEQPTARDSNSSQQDIAPSTEQPPAPTHPPAEIATLQEKTGRDDGQPARIAVHAHQKDIRKHWPDFIAYVKDRIVWMAQDLNRAKVKEVEDELQLRYDDPAECSLLRRSENKNQLTEFVLDFFQKELTVTFMLPKEDITPENGNDDSPHKKRQQLANDPLTIMTAEIFHGQVGDIRIGPRSR